MRKKLSPDRIKENIAALLASEEGILTILGASLVLSDFDDIETALEEARKAYNGNSRYFNRIQMNWENKK